MYKTIHSGTIRAICARNFRMTAADIATSSGLSLSSVHRELNALAARVEAVLAVDDQGCIVYQFPEDLERALRARSFADAIRRTLGLCVRFAGLVPAVVLMAVSAVVVLVPAWMLLGQAALSWLYIGGQLLSVWQTGPLGLALTTTILDL